MGKGGDITGMEHGVVKVSERNDYCIPACALSLQVDHVITLYDKQWGIYALRLIMNLPCEDVMRMVNPSGVSSTAQCATMPICVFALG